MNRRLVPLLAAAAGLIAAAPLLAQIEKPTEQDIQAAPKQFQGLIRGTSTKLGTAGGPPGGPGGPGGAQKVVARQPSKDPRDFTGNWAAGMGGGPRGGGAGGAGGPGAGPGNAGPGAAGPGGAAPAGAGGAGSGRGGDDRLGTVTPTKVEVSRICLVDSAITSATMMIYQNAHQVTLVYANELRARRIYLDAQHPKDVKPSYGGDSVGHWEGNTLVIDTIGLKGSLGMVGFDVENGSYAVRMVSPTLHVTERITKINEGAQLENRMHFEDPAAGLVPFDKTVTYSYAPDAMLLETECEDFGDAFGPGYAK
ncbi:MAG: hypothetical protein QM718_04045 [Steroidobacteraceae bacterium]